MGMENEEKEKSKKGAKERLMGGRACMHMHGKVRDTHGLYFCD